MTFRPVTGQYRSVDGQAGRFAARPEESRGLGGHDPRTATETPNLCAVGSIPTPPAISPAAVPPSLRRALSAGTKQLRGACRLLRFAGDIASEPNGSKNLTGRASIPKMLKPFLREETRGSET